MKALLIAFLLVASLVVWAQGRGSTGRPSGTGGGPPSGAGRPDTAGAPADAGGRPADAGKPANAGSQAHTQRPLKDSQINSGAFRMLEKKTGMTSDQLQALYTSSGAKNFGQFVSAIVVSKNLGLDMNAVLDGLKTQSLGQTLQSLGVSPEDAKKAEAQAKKETKQANKGS
ncbi:MAG: hypothetical protein ACRD2K_01560 [Terriglobales bacterium]